MSLLLLAFVVYVYWNPTDVPFCFSGAEGAVCASGAAAPSGHDVLTVTLLGTLGGLLAAILAIKNMHGTASPYNVPQALALLKLPLGAVSAIGALITIRGDFIPGFSNLDSQAQILAYAFGFGLAQQLLTGLVDKQARSILSTAPGKATGATRPERQLPRPRPPVPAEPDEDAASSVVRRPAPSGLSRLRGRVAHEALDERAQVVVDLVLPEADVVGLLADHHAQVVLLAVRAPGTASAAGSRARRAATPASSRGSSSPPGDAARTAMFAKPPLRTSSTRVRDLASSADDDADALPGAWTAATSAASEP